MVSGKFCFIVTVYTGNCFFFGWSLLFHVIFCVQSVFMLLYLLKQQQLNCKHIQNSASF